MGAEPDFLRRVPLFRDLDTDALAAVARACIERRYERGQVIFSEEETGQTMYLVVSGRVKVSRWLASGREVILAFHPAGDYFGEMALIDRQPRSALAKAHDAGAVVLAIPEDVVEGLLDMRKVSSLRLLHILCGLVAKRLREIDDKLVGWFILAGGNWPAGGFSF